MLPLLIVDGDGPTLLSRDWLSQINLNWRQIHLVHSPNLQSLSHVTRQSSGRAWVLSKASTPRSMWTLMLYRAFTLPDLSRLL